MARLPPVRANVKTTAYDCQIHNMSSEFVFRTTELKRNWRWFRVSCGVRSSGRESCWRSRRAPRRSSWWSRRTRSPSGRSPATDLLSTWGQTDGQTSPLTTTIRRDLSSVHILPRLTWSKTFREWRHIMSLLYLICHVNPNLDSLCIWICIR